MSDDLERFMEAGGWPPGSEELAAEALAIGRGEGGCLQSAGARQWGARNLVTGEVAARLPDGTAVRFEATGPPQIDMTTGEPHTGSMVALIPDQESIDRLVASGVVTEPAEQIHLTLDYLGDAEAIGAQAQAAMLDEAEHMAARLGPVDANVFGASVWNAGGDTPSLVLSVGDGPGGGDLLMVHLGATNLRSVGAATDETWEPAVAHSPWVAHVCLGYGDPAELRERMEAASALEGPIRFDRLRVTFGGDAFDHELTGGAPAEGESMTAATADVETPVPDDDAPSGTPSGTGRRPGARPEAMAGEHAVALMHVVGETTGFRTFEDTTTRTPPFAFHWQKSSSAHGGMPAVSHVGNVVRVVENGPELYGFITLDLGSVDGAEYGRRLVAGVEHGVSIGLDESPVETELVWPPGVDPENDLMAEPEQVIMRGGRVGELTGVSVPAQHQAVIEPTDELRALLTEEGAPPLPAEPDTEGVLAASAVPAPHTPCGCGDSCCTDERSPADVIQAVTAAAHTITVHELPPAAWYLEPTDVDIEGAFCLSDEGRIYGLLAPLGTGHRAFVKAGKRMEVPYGKVDYGRFMGAWALTAAGRVPAGPLTMDCGHAPIHRTSHDQAPAHYDNSCTVLGAVAVGESRRLQGVWIAGALLPGVRPDQIARALACRVSGDWQPHPDRRGWKELVAALLVPSPGYGSEHPEGMRASYDSEGALVASSAPVRYVDSTGLGAAEPDPEPDLSGAFDRLLVASGHGPDARVAQLLKRAGR